MLFHILASRTRQSPEKTALVYGTARIRYADLYEQVRAFSNGLRACGLTSSDAVALLLPNCPEFIISFYAIARLHASIVALNNLLQKQELRYCLQDSRVRMVITTVQGAEICHQLRSELKQPIELIVIDGVHHAATSFSDVMHSRAADTVASDTDMTYDGPVLYQYSSGSTGRPKRIERTQRNLVRETENFLATTQVTSTDTFCCVVPLFHAHGLGNCMLAAIGAGATLVILERIVRDGLTIDVPFPARCHEVLQLMEREQVTVFAGVPYIFAALAEAVQERNTQLASVHLCFSAGNFLAKPTFDLFWQRFGVPIRQQYGCTEAGSVTINLEDAKDLHFDAVGLPMKNVAVIVIDDAMREVPDGVIGEIAIRSEALTTGYCDMEELNRRVFRDGYFFPGDLGRKDEHGKLYITGRKRVIIDTGGRKVDPLEVEDVLASHPQVAEAVVVGVPGQYGGEVIKAVIVPRGECTEQELIAYCRERMASYKMPRLIEFRQAIPLSPLGKILRKDLTQPVPLNWSEADTQALREVLSATSSREQRLTHLQRHLQKQLASLLYIDPSHVPTRKPFGEIGLDSVSAVELRNRIEITLGLHCSATLIWSYPTIGSLASHLNERMFENEQTIVQALQENDASTLWIEQLPNDEVRKLLAEYVPTEKLSLERRRLLALHNGQSQQRGKTDRTSEPLAIIGMSCRFPGGVTTPEALWQLLCEQQDAIIEVPDTRWDINAFHGCRSIRSLFFWPFSS
ncbi:MAG: hypothetical protein E6J34_07395 [Chloroflexi bacterium]|nr:MAG: hypothetical protein E6J34_07395 [Chloroflexota bacterium]